MCVCVCVYMYTEKYIFIAYKLQYKYILQNCFDWKK